MTRPSFDTCITALSGPSATPEEGDIAALLTDIELNHRPSADDADMDGHWGRCSGCRELWPCQQWAFFETLAVQFIGRAADRVWAKYLPPIEDDTVAV